MSSEDVLNIWSLTRSQYIRYLNEGEQEARFSGVSTDFFAYRICDSGRSWLTVDLIARSHESHPKMGEVIIMGMYLSFFFTFAHSNGMS